MSRVFVAVETELDRQIVIKVLPPDLAAGLNVERFRREIQLAAKLQHPHIVPLLSAGAKDGLLYFTMPLISGESLRTRLTRQRELPVHDAIRILRDVVDALAYAHANGVVHRDIKPDNVLLSGHHAVVTDFGVAKALANSTGSSTLTSMGVALGTPAYMSPEQAAADPNVDHRADIYSVGALAYELLTGRQVFVGMTPQQMLSAHMTQAAEPLSKHRSAVSPALDQVIMRCLEKKPADRWQSAEQLLSQLEVLATPSGGMTPQPMVPVRLMRRSNWKIVAALAAAAVIGGLWWNARSRESAIAIVSTLQVTNTPGLELDPALSPDGQSLAYSAGMPGRMRIHVRQIAGGRVLELSTGLSGEHRLPQWSPDGSKVLFHARGRMYTVPAFGGAPAVVGEGGALGVGAAWSPDGQRIAYSREDTIWVTGANGGPSQFLLMHRTPHSLAWSPDGKRIAFVSENPQFAYGGTAAFGNLGPNSMWTVAASGGSAVRVTAPGFLYASPVWTSDSRSLLYVSNSGGSRDLYEQTLASNGSPRGGPRRLTTGLGAHGISISRDGTRLAYSVLQYRTNVFAAAIPAANRPAATSVVALTDENQAVEGVGITPDGAWLVFDSNRGGNSDIYKMRTTGGEPIQLTKDSADDFIPQWSRDGSQIVFHSWRNNNRDVYTMNLDGGDVSQVTADTLHDMYPDFSPDGDRVVFHHLASTRQGAGILISARDASRRWGREHVVTLENGTVPRWTHDGRYIAFASIGRDDDFVGIIDTAGGKSRKLATSREVGARVNSVAVGPDTSVVYFRAVDSTGVNTFYSVGIAGGRPRLLARLDDPRRRPRRHEFATDSKRLYFTMSEDESDIWVMELRKRQ